MTLGETLTVAALIIGPILAVQVEKYLQRKRETKFRKEQIFKTLMATRGSVLSSPHVEALNRIDLEFSHDDKYKKVTSSWKEYFDNLYIRVTTNEEIAVWSARNEELLSNLLYEMGLSLGYDFDKALIKRNIYSPVGHARVERENELIREGLLNIMTGKATFPINIQHVEIDPDAIRRQNELQSLMIEYYRRGNQLPTSIEHQN